MVLMNNGAKLFYWVKLRALDSVKSVGVAGDLGTRKKMFGKCHDLWLQCLCFCACALFHSQRCYSGLGGVYGSRGIISAAFKDLNHRATCCQMITFTSHGTWLSQ